MSNHCLFLVVLCVAYFNVFDIIAQDIDDSFSTGNPTGEFKFEQSKPTRYLLYEVNPGEGFNLRRDVFMRMANLVKLLNKNELWTLVLPPWNRLYHWRSVLEQSQIQWSTFFDLDSIRKHIPVIEFVDFLNATEGQPIDEVHYLQIFREGWRDGKWEERMEERECNEKNSFIQDVDGLWRWWFWDYPDVTAKTFRCVSIQAEYSFLASFLLKNTTSRSVFFVRAEHVIHGTFSEWSPEYWMARRSMRFAKHLRELGDEFREKFLGSTDVNDKTILKEDWRKMKRKHGHAIGGPYVAVHLRRQDFLYSHQDEVPSLAGAAKQIEAALLKNNVTKVFVATDAPETDFDELKKHLSGYEVYRYNPPEDVLAKYKDGGIAIIDQWICAHARFFMGTSVSTFSFRIHEEREILGFSTESTFNRLCPDAVPNCEQPSKWTIVYEK